MQVSIADVNSCERDALELQYRNLVRCDKKEFAVALAREAEAAASNYDSVTVYHFTKRLTGGRTFLDGPARNVNSRLLIKNNKQRESIKFDEVE